MKTDQNSDLIAYRGIQWPSMRFDQQFATREGQAPSTSEEPERMSKSFLGKQGIHALGNNPHEMWLLGNIPKFFLASRHSAETVG